MNLPANSALQEDRIRSALSPAAAGLLRHLTVLAETDSTNSAVTRLPAEAQHRHAVLAERQTRGRGRRQRHWHSPAGGNLYLSLGWRFDSERQPLATLPLVVAVCLSRLLERAGLAEHGIKWPNDILVGDRKLAGILVEMQSAGSGPALAVTGIGLNVAMPGDREADERIGQPWTDLVSWLPTDSGFLDRNRLAAALLEELLAGFERFEETGFMPFEADWRKRDRLLGRTVVLESASEKVAGIARGLDGEGGLLIEMPDGGVSAWHSGEVSVRHE